MNNEFDELMEACGEIDHEAYKMAHDQAEAIYEFLMEADECSKMTISFGGLAFDLDIFHTDILNEIYTMLSNLMKLRDQD